MYDAFSRQIGPLRIRNNRTHVSRFRGGARSCCSPAAIDPGWAGSPVSMEDSCGGHANVCERRHRRLAMPRPLHGQCRPRCPRRFNHLPARGWIRTGATPSEGGMGRAHADPLGCRSRHSETGGRSRPCPACPVRRARYDDRATNRKEVRDMESPHRAHQTAISAHIHPIV